MKYYEEYFSKFGFDDGDSIPPDAEEHWIQAQELVNTFAEKYLSEVRLVRFFRNGMHNPYLFFLASKDDPICKDGGLLENTKDFTEVQRDEAFEKAEGDAISFYNDGGTAVYTKVELDYLRLNDLIQEIKEMA